MDEEQILIYGTVLAKKAYKHTNIALKTKCRMVYLQREQINERTRKIASIQYLHYRKKGNQELQ